MGISEQEISTAKVLAVFSFSRLLSAVPLTPGGVGVIDLGYVGGLDGGDPRRPEGGRRGRRADLPRCSPSGSRSRLGGFTYFIWLKNKSWRKEPPPESVEGQELAAEATA